MAARNNALDLMLTVLLAALVCSLSLDWMSGWREPFKHSSAFGDASEGDPGPVSGEVSSAIAAIGWTSGRTPEKTAMERDLSIRNAGCV